MKPKQMSSWLFNALLAYGLTPEFIFQLEQKSLECYIVDALYYKRTGINLRDGFHSTFDSFGVEVTTAFEDVKYENKTASSHEPSHS